MRGIFFELNFVLKNFKNDFIKKPRKSGAK